VKSNNVLKKAPSKPMSFSKSPRRDPIKKNQEDNSEVLLFMEILVKQGQ
jgi:hypothetical protein